jgi:2-polyprenyl-3-methyl-5-hydroxy-6-metoxy-1,4-benzoquinol methylase
MLAAESSWFFECVISSNATESYNSLGTEMRESRDQLGVYTTTNNGLHDFVTQRVLSGYAGPGICAVDLGSGPGAMAVRLQSLGCSVLAVDRSADGFAANAPHREVDFNDREFASQVGEGQFDLVTAIEVIEHLESPIGFLRNVGRLLSPRGVAVLTTPNVDSLPARLRFLVGGKIRTMDERSEPTHISPIFVDLLKRQFLPQAGLKLRDHLLFPSDGFQLTRKQLGWMFRIASRMLPGESLMGDNHVLVLEKRDCFL